MKVKDIIHTNLITADKKESIYEIAKKMKEYNIGMIPICDKEKIIGILTDRDIVIDMIASKDLENIEKYIHTKIITIPIEEKITAALQKMKEEKVKRLLVTKEKEIVGILSLSDIIEKKEMEKEVMDTIKTIFRKDIAQKEKTAEIDEFYL